MEKLTIKDKARETEIKFFYENEEIIWFTMEDSQDFINFRLTKKNLIDIKDYLDRVLKIMASNA